MDDQELLVFACISIFHLAFWFLLLDDSPSPLLSLAVYVFGVGGMIDEQKRIYGKLDAAQHIANSGAII